MWRASLGWVLSAVLLLYLHPTAGAAEVARDNLSTMSVLDWAKTSAALDTARREIRLPTLPNTISFWPSGVSGGQDVSVLESNGVTVYSPASNGTYVPNPDLSFTFPTGTRVAGLAAAGDIHPDVVVALRDAGGERVVRYSYTGTGMKENPALSAAGFAELRSVGVQPGAPNFSVVDANTFRTFKPGASGMEEDAWFGIPTGLSGPIAAALNPTDFQVAVAEQDRVRFYKFSGSSMVEDPTLAITGLAAARAVVWTATDEVAVLDSVGLRRYEFNGAGFTEDTAVRVTGLTDAWSVAVQPGTGDRFVVRADGIHVYAWDGTGYTEDPTRFIANQQAARYRAEAVAVRQPVPAAGTISSMRVTASYLFAAPPVASGRLVIWSVSANGGQSWIMRYRVRPGPICEITNDGGLTWLPTTSCGVNNPDLWVQIPPVDQGSQAAWKAVLVTDDQQATPVILPDVILEVNAGLAVSNLRVTQVANRPPNSVDCALIPLPAGVPPPVCVKAGAQFEFKVDVTGQANSVVAVFDDPGRTLLQRTVSLQPDTGNPGTWVGTYFTEANSDIVPPGTVVSVTVTATDAGGQSASVTSAIIKTPTQQEYSSVNYDWAAILQGSAR